MSPLHLIDIGVALPEVFLAVGGMLLLMIGAFVGEKSSKMVTTGAVAVLLVTLVITVTADFGDGLLAFNGLFRADSFGVFMKAIVLVASAVSLILSQDYFDRAGIARFEFPVLVVFATLGMLLMISANDLISLYVGLELQSLALYVVASINRDDMRSTEAGLKYFVLGALSSGMLLYGSSMVYGFAGTTNFDGIAHLLGDMAQPQVGVVVGLVLVIAGLAFKISAVPFHMWTPDVYEGAPTPVTAFFSSAPKVAAIALFVRVLIGPFGDMADQWQQILEFISIASMLLGAFAAINQTNIKRLMAYSSIGHMGYALIGLASASPGGVSGIVTYMAIYVVMGLGTFAVILSMRTKDGPVEKITDLAGLSRNSPAMAAALAIFMFSMAGIPPLAGFFGKLFVFQAAVEAKLYTLAVIGVLSSVVGAFYYLRIIKVMYFDEPAPMFVPAARGVSIVTGASALLTLLFFVMPAPLVSGAYTVAARLFGG